MKKKGFTLIELLAVIVILAVIALIATPMILGVIETARKGAAESSAYGYIEALENYQVMSEFTNEEKFTGVVQVNEINKKIDLKGEKPTNGTVIITDGKITNYELQFGDYLVKYNDTNKKAEASKEEVEYAVGTEIKIDNVLYHVIKTSYKNDETVTLLRYESIGDMKFDENGGTDFETSTLKTYLNTTYKETFGEKASMIVGDITLLDFGTYTPVMEDGVDPAYDISGEEGTYAYLYKNGYNNILESGQFWTKTVYGNSSNSRLIISFNSGAIFYSDDSGNGTYASCGTSGAGCTSYDYTGFATRPVITIKKEAL